MPLTDEVSVAEVLGLIAQPNEKDSLCVILATSGRLILGTSENYVLAAAQFNLVFHPCGRQKVVCKSSVQIVQTEISRGFLCVSTAELHLSDSGQV